MLRTGSTKITRHKTQSNFNNQTRKKLFEIFKIDYRLDSCLSTDRLFLGYWNFQCAALARHLANLRLAFLPSSLTEDHSFTLGYSPSLPVSVLVRIFNDKFREFSRQPALFCWSLRRETSSRSLGYTFRIYLESTLIASTSIQ